MNTLRPADAETARFLVARGLLTPAQRDEATDLAARWGSGLQDALLARNWIDAQTYFKALSDRYGLRYVDLVEHPSSDDLILRDEAEDYVRHQCMPWRRVDGRLTVATCSPDPATRDFIGQRWGPDTEVVICTKFAFRHALQRAFSAHFMHRAVNELAERDPVMSARIVFTPVQIAILWVAATVLFACFYQAPVATAMVLLYGMSLFYLGNFVFKGMLVWVGSKVIQERTQELELAVKNLRDQDLPTYTVLVPMFREPDVMPILANALRKLDYPASKLDVKIVLEEGDHETIAAARALNLEHTFEIILVPPSQPQTKPKACNYALNFARGEYLVIFDAEDKPEPDQLKKVVAAFRRAPDNVACIQCRLNYYNRDENWLTRMFTLDYSLWFDQMLPGLEKLRIPIPLGGTSNHFKMGVLRQLHAWDPFNVTEDADLGIRLTQKGYRVQVVESTTFEEANVSHGNWIRQRSRWIKGYMQTFLVHTRRPLHLLRTIGPMGVVGFTFFVAGTMLSGLLNPLFWLVFIITLVAEINTQSLFPTSLLYISLFNLLAGNGLYMFLMMLAPYRRNWLHLVPISLTVFWYWVLMSVAAWKATWQLFTKPFYWEKTVHGLSKFTAGEIAAARSESGAATPS